MHDVGLVREVALGLAVAVDEPDVEPLVPTRVAKESDLLRVRRPARRHRPLLRVGELVEALALDRRAVDLERPAAVPRERDLGAVRREIDTAPEVVDVRRADEVVDRHPTEALADRTRLVSESGRHDVGGRIRDGRRRPFRRRGPPVLGERLRSLPLLARRRRWIGRGGRRGRGRRGARAVASDGATRGQRALRLLEQLARRARDDQRGGTHRRLAHGGVLLRDDDFVVVHLVLEASLVRAVPRRRQEDAELLARFRQLALELKEHVAARVPDRRALRRQHRREREGDELFRALAREIEVAAEEDAAGLADEDDGGALPVPLHAEDTRVRTHEVVRLQNEIGAARDRRGIVLVHRDLHAERLAIPVLLVRAGRIRRQQERRAARALDEPQRALAVGRYVDEKVAARGVEDDVLALVIERRVELEDPRTQLLDVHGGLAYKFRQHERSVDARDAALRFKTRDGPFDLLVVPFEETLHLLRRDPTCEL